MTAEVYPAPADGGQSLVERPPAPALFALVDVVWVHQIGRDALPYVHRRVPNGTAELVCTVGSAPRVIGPLTGPLVEVLEPGATVVGLRFAPGAFAAIAGRPVSEVAELAVGAEDLWGRSAVALGEAVAAADSATAALAAVQRNVHDRAVAGTAPDPLVSAVVRGLMSWHTTDVTSLRASLHLSETQLRRRFRSAAGLAPKTLHRILRFQRFLALAQQAIIQGRTATDDGLALIAVRVGYADQSHLTRECVRLTGAPPRVFLADTQQACACGHDHATSLASQLRTRTW